MRVWSLIVVPAVTSLLIAACGSDDSSVFNNGGKNDAGGDVTVGPPPTLGDSGGEGSAGRCKPKTCADLGYDCGKNADGCGGLLDCGSCMSPEFCGAGGYSKCGGNLQAQDSGGNICTPKTCAQQGFTCGQNSDGCGNLLQCGTCNAPEFCGGGGYSKCGGNSIAADSGGSVCVPKTCAQQNFNCGPAGDGCGNPLSCGTCAAPEFCGGGGVSQCGGNTQVNDAGGNVCVPRTCAQLGYNCGPASDGCGGQLSCGACSAPQFCGGGGFDVCGGNSQALDSGGSICTPTTCAALGYNCGPVGDGCGGMLDCGTCTSPQYCGGGGFDTCGGNMNALDGGSVCVPKTCAQLGYNCGPAGDGCGNLLNCGSCLPPDICGGGGVPSQCGDSNLDAGDAAACTGLCQQIPVCDSAAGTTVTGRVYAPTDPTLGYGAPDPIQHAHVFIPNDPSSLTAFGTQVACACDTASGPAIATTFSAIDGTFTLTNVPAGNNIPVVIQLGRWRRVYYTNIAPCVPNSITNDATCRAGGACNTRLPRHEHEFNNFDNIPLIAEVTGSADPIECVLPKIGIDTTSYSNPGGTGRVQFYQANGATFSGATPNESNLWSSAATLEGYDMVILDCEGSEHTETAAALANMQAYANAGGRVFASHYSYVWTFTNDPWGCGGEAANGNPTPPTATCTTAGHTVADWYADQAQPTPDPINGIIDNPTMQAWLAQPLIGIASPILLGAPRHDTTGVIAPNAMGVPATQLYVHADPAQSANNPLEFTFNTPPFAPAANQCGRVLFSDFHVNTGGAGTGRFPAECNGASPMTAQEKVLEFMLFDLGDCVPTIQPPPPPTCTPLTCAQQNIACGPAGDGCGNLLQCGTCTPPQTCGGGGVSGHCGSVDAGQCTPETCAQQGIQCGPAGDGCGNLLQCGTCTPPLQCGGAGQHGVCGFTDGGTCAPRTCAQQNISCGPAGDGCGNLLQCGTCTPPLQCGGGGQPGVCGLLDGGSCNPETCAQQGFNCGPAGDGCGNMLSCGTCTPPATCGGGGQSGVCGFIDGGSCVPLTCGQLGFNCGPAGDGCGGLLQCGPCTPPATCGGAGQPGVCGFVDAGSCAPKTCAELGISCGPAGDGCGGLLQCGNCTAPATCGGGGQPGVCGGGNK